ncbi:PhaM family polyhydroxyalkanoate granule multifunctional regulatory protein [Paracidovorax konjaci]|uniref:Uncharacterized protein n=1 Tax=Paracidovorax konjaci TaxID=32040 RepID=A0A1I1Y9F9_9BURK|nr:PhaM family polyhydroxyalkanoate granule multifunctional regulatory protein [Paracidovorax konjaci]SFE16194.1 hypothetical protein SAMN04489710_11680 [Paracidovorax konjaci]
MSSNQSNPTQDTSPFGFGRFVPGFDFLQNLAKGASAGMPQMPSLSGWVAPTISVEELEKRIEELKAVQFWLDQNSRALTATVQALEVQKMTLATLQGMNVAMGDLASAFTPRAAEAPAAASPAAPQAPRPDPFAKARPAAAPEAAAAAPAPAPAPAPAEAPSAAPAADAPPPAAPGVIDPMQWWTALTGQFQQIAANAMSDASKLPAMNATQGLAAEALKSATDIATQLAAQGMQGMQGMQKAARKASAGAAAADGGDAPAGKAAARPAAKATAKRPASGSASAPEADAAGKRTAAPATARRAAAAPRNRK